MEDSTLTREALLAEGTAADLFAKYDGDSNGILDAKELQKLITHCLKQLMSVEDDSMMMDDLMSDFSLGSREYCMLVLQLISEDGEVTLEKFQEWIQQPENFLFFPARKFKVMLWACDLFREFDVNGDGWITEEEFDQAMTRLNTEMNSGIADASAGILSELKFNQYDVNGDGQVSASELITAILAMWDRLYDALFQDADNFFDM